MNVDLLQAVKRVQATQNGPLDLTHETGLTLKHLDRFAAPYEPVKLTREQIANLYAEAQRSVRWEEPHDYDFARRGDVTTIRDRRVIPDEEVPQ